ncbi:hypothetical protein HOY82DRAFT_536472 [Tuber indicum]|nr:hypothetical protein HOY82DRAFT_536472 [Tuber indicum]
MAAYPTVLHKRVVVPYCTRTLHYRANNSETENRFKDLSVLDIIPYHTASPSNRYYTTILYQSMNRYGVSSPHSTLSPDQKKSVVVDPALWDQHRASSPASKRYEYKYGTSARAPCPETGIRKYNCLYGKNPVAAARTPTQTHDPVFGFSLPTNRRRREILEHLHFSVYSTPQHRVRYGRLSSPQPSQVPLITQQFVCRYDTTVDKANAIRALVAVAVVVVGGLPIYHSSMC